jgi:hypothetical protein
MFTELHGKRSACFANVASATFAGNVVDTLLSDIMEKEYNYRTKLNRKKGEQMYERKFSSPS